MKKFKGLFLLGLLLLTGALHAQSNYRAGSFGFAARSTLNIFPHNNVVGIGAGGGWRLGFGAGPATLIRAIARIQAQSSLHPSSISQAAAVAALSGPQDIVRARRAEFEQATPMRHRPQRPKEPFDDTAALKYVRMLHQLNVA